MVKQITLNYFDMKQTIPKSARSCVSNVVTRITRPSVEGFPAAAHAVWDNVGVLLVAALRGRGPVSLRR